MREGRGDMTGKSCPKAGLYGTGVKFVLLLRTIIQKYSEDNVLLQCRFHSCSKGRPL